jgi:FkbM family methyltransferase
MTQVREAPLWVRAAAAVIGRAPAARYRMANALARFAGEPFLMRLPASLGGYAFHCDIRDSVAREVCFTGRYEPQETQLAARVLAPGMTVVDVGANWGYFTLAAAHWVGESGRVIAFEPEPRLFEMLTANAARNNLAQVTVRPFAVAAGAGRVRLQPFDEMDGNWGTSQIGGTGGIECRTVGLDEQLDAEQVSGVDLLKIDVEGGEADVLQGMSRGLAQRRFRYVLLECHPDALARRGSSVNACVRPFVDAGYRADSIVHSPDVHRRAATRDLPIGELLRPLGDRSAAGAWPHFFFTAPGAQALS